MSRSSERSRTGVWLARPGSRCAGSNGKRIVGFWPSICPGSAVATQVLAGPAVAVDLQTHLVRWTGSSSVAAGSVPDVRTRLCGHLRDVRRWRPHSGAVRVCFFTRRLSPENSPRRAAVPGGLSRIPPAVFAGVARPGRHRSAGGRGCAAGSWPRRTACCERRGQPCLLAFSPEVAIRVQEKMGQLSAVVAVAGTGSRRRPTWPEGAVSTGGRRERFSPLTGRPSSHIMYSPLRHQA